jgi:hypothetical protein
VGRITYLSGMLVDSGLADHLPEQRAKAAAEYAVRTSGLPWTVFRPTYFMETLARHVVSPHTAIVIGRRLPPLHVVAAADFGRMVATALTGNGDHTATFFVRGPRAIHLKSALEQYCVKLHPRARVRSVAVQVMRLVDRVFTKGSLRPQIDLMSVLEQTGEIGDTSVTERVFGSPRIDFDDEVQRAQCAQRSPRERHSRIAGQAFPSNGEQCLNQLSHFRGKSVGGPLFASAGVYK